MYICMWRFLAYCLVQIPQFSRLPNSHHLFPNLGWRCPGLGLRSPSPPFFDGSLRGVWELGPLPIAKPGGAPERPLPVVLRFSEHAC